jgi:hypothetical protein
MHKPQPNDTAGADGTNAVSPHGNGPRGHEVPEGCLPMGDHWTSAVNQPPAVLEGLRTIRVHPRPDEIGYT